MCRFLLVFAITFIYVRAVAAGEPAAIVEEASQSTGLQVMDYLESGRIIKLVDDESLVIGYLESCIRETIVGGTILIGFEQSVLDGGKVVREKLNCSGSGMTLSPSQMQESGALIFRSIGGKANIPVSYGLQPVIIALETGPLTIRRVDRNEPQIRLEKRVPALDLIETSTELAAGGVYRVDIAAKTFIFAVAPDARRGRLSLISRLIRLK